MTAASTADTPTPSALEALPYPDNPALRSLFRSPMLLFRLGLGSLVGRLFMVMTTTGRKSGQPRRAVVEYQSWNGRKYAIAAWPKSDWYQNLMADPRVTVQTADGVEQMTARRVTDDAELAAVYDNVYSQASPEIQQFWEALGFEMNRESFLGNKDQLHLLVFEPTSQPTPPPLEADLQWVWPLVAVVVVAGLVGMIMRRRT